MTTRLCILVLAVAALTTRGAADSLINELADKPVAQILTLLESPDCEMRVAAAFSIQLRYQKDSGFTPHRLKEQNPEFPLPAQVVPRLAEHLKSDPYWRARVLAARALGALRPYTNTTSLVSAGLQDTNAYVKVWTSDVLIHISQDNSEPLVPSIIPTLEQCLGVDSPEEPTWIAASIAGDLGGAGKPLLPSLQNLSGHASSKVRQYAREAIKKIRHGEKKTR